MSTESTLISIREAARRLGVHDNTVRRYADRGLIGSMRLPSGVRRVSSEDVDAFAVAARDRLGRDLDARSPEEGLKAGGQVPEASLEDLFAPELWRSDEEVAEFLALTYAERDRDR